MSRYKELVFPQESKAFHHLCVHIAHPATEYIKCRIIKSSLVIQENIFSYPYKTNQCGKEEHKDNDHIYRQQRKTCPEFPPPHLYLPIHMNSAINSMPSFFCCFGNNPLNLLSLFGTLSDFLPLEKN